MKDVGKQSDPLVLGLQLPNSRDKHQRMLGLKMSLALDKTINYPLREN